MLRANKHTHTCGAEGRHNLVSQCFTNKKVLTNKGALSAEIIWKHSKAGRGTNSVQA